MRLRQKFLNVVLACSICSVLALSGCAAGEKSSSGESTGSESKKQTEQEASSPDGEETSEARKLGTFSMQDINGETYTQEMFAGYDLTMINVFTTWCTPCVNEIPDLEKLSNDMAGQGLQVAGIVLNAIGPSGDADDGVVEKARLLAKKTGASYPFLIPERSYLNGRLFEINAVPETFFVDQEGNIVGDTYSGSRSYEDWKKIVEQELEGAAQ